MKKEYFYRLFGGIGVSLMLLTGCKRDIKDINMIDSLPSKEVILEHLKNDSIREMKLDSLLSSDLKYVETTEQLNAEIDLLTKAFDSIEQSNLNLNNYIKHQDKMINNGKK